MKNEHDFFVEDLTNYIEENGLELLFETVLKICSDEHAKADKERNQIILDSQDQQELERRIKPVAARLVCWEQDSNVIYNIINRPTGWSYGHPIKHL